MTPASNSTLFFKRHSFIPTAKMSAEDGDNAWLFDYMMNVFRAPTWEVSPFSLSTFSLGRSTRARDAAEEL